MNYETLPARIIKRFNVLSASPVARTLRAPVVQLWHVRFDPAGMLMEEAEEAANEPASTGHLTAAVREALSHGNWYAALALALALPDICGYLEFGSMKSRADFLAWYDANLLRINTMGGGLGRPEHVLMSGGDCYALRCAFLHQGSEDVSTQRKKDVVRQFLFSSPMGRNRVHRFKSGDRLILDVEWFCGEVCDAVDAWDARVLAVRPDAQARASEMLRIGGAEDTMDRFGP